MTDDKISNWDLEDMPAKFDFKVLTEPNLATGEIEVITEVMGKIQREMYQTKSDQVRNALIDLGWTPPEGKEHERPSKLKPGFREKWLHEFPETVFMFGIPVNELPLQDILAVVNFLMSELHESRKQWKST